MELKLKKLLTPPFNYSELFKNLKLITNEFYKTNNFKELGIPYYSDKEIETDINIKICSYLLAGIVVNNFFCFKFHCWQI